MQTLQFSVDAYGMPRFIVIDGACSCLFSLATRGSGHAVDELLCLVHDVCDTLVDKSPTLTLTLFVDER